VIYFYFSKELYMNQTEEHFHWFEEQGITHLDIGGLDRTSGKMLNRLNISINDVIRYLKWLRYLNTNGHCIFVRPARGYSWGMLFVDDVSPEMVSRFRYAYDCLPIRTSKNGGFQLWIPVYEALDEEERKDQQRELVAVLNGDPGSVSGEHFGRFAGFRNHKRGTDWCNLMRVEPAGELWRPGAAIPTHGGFGSNTDKPKRSQPISSGSSGEDESRKEFGWACGWLSSGLKQEEGIKRLEQRASGRGKRQPHNYAKRTFVAAGIRVGVVVK